MNGVALLVTVIVLGLFGTGLATGAERVGRVARRPNGRHPKRVARGLGGLSCLLALALLLFWLLG